MAVPGAGDTDRAETCRLDGVHQSLCGVGIAPSGRVVRHFHRVADIETHAHVGLDFFGGGERRCGRRKGSCEGKEGGFGENMLHLDSCENNPSRIAPLKVYRKIHINVLNRHCVQKFIERLTTKCKFTVARQVFIFPIGHVFRKKAG